MRLSAASLALSVVAFHVVTAVIAVFVNLPAQFTTGGEPKENVGWDVLISGSAVSAPLPPIVVLLVGVWLVRRRGRSRKGGLVLLVLVCAVMTIGWVAEYASGIPFTGDRYAVFLVLSILGILITLALAVQSVRELLARDSP